MQPYYQVAALSTHRIQFSGPLAKPYSLRSFSSSLLLYDKVISRTKLQEVNIRFLLYNTKALGLLSKFINYSKIGKFILYTHNYILYKLYIQNNQTSGNLFISNTDGCNLLSVRMFSTESSSSDIKPC